MRQSLLLKEEVAQRVLPGIAVHTSGYGKEHHPFPRASPIHATGDGAGSGLEVCSMRLRPELIHSEATPVNSFRYFVFYPAERGQMRTSNPPFRTIICGGSRGCTPTPLS